MGKNALSGIMLTLLLVSMLTLASNIRLVKAETYYYSNLTITVTPESPRTNDNVSVKVSFNTESKSYIVGFARSGFGISIIITIPEVVVPETGYAEKTVFLGKLAKGAYTFSVSLMIYDFHGNELFRTWYAKSFAVGPVSIASLNAPCVIDNSLVPGTIFRINVTLDNVEQLWGWEFGIWYNSSVLTAIDYWAYPPFNTPLVSEINDASGYVYLAFSTFNGDRTGFSTTDPTPIAWIDFYVDNTGTSKLDFSYHSALATIIAKEIPHREVNGFFDNRYKSIVATVDIDPDALNLRTNGKWVSSYIELPEGYNAADINVATILLNGVVAPVLDPSYGFVTNSNEYLVDRDGDGALERMVKFNAAKVVAILNAGEATLTITGEVNGILFEASGTITVID